MKTLQAILIACALAGVVGSSSAAKDRGVTKGRKPDKSEPAAAEDKPGHKPEALVKMKFSEEERRVIQTYAAGKRAKDLPPGLRRKMAKGGSLPPGWQKKVAAGEVMPIEVYKAATPLPPEIVLKLPPPPRGVIHVTIEGKVVRLLEATREIIDVFEIGRR